MIYKMAMIEWYTFGGMETTTISFRYPENGTAIRKQVTIKGVHNFGIGLSYELCISDDSELVYAYLKYAIG